MGSSGAAAFASDYTTRSGTPGVGAELVSHTVDACPADDAKTDPGQCGCGVAETACGGHEDTSSSGVPWLWIGVGVAAALAVSAMAAYLVFVRGHQTKRPASGKGKGGA